MKMPERKPRQIDALRPRSEQAIRDNIQVWGVGEMSEILVKKRKVRERERRGFCWEIVAFSFLILDRYH